MAASSSGGFFIGKSPCCPCRGVSSFCKSCVCKRKERSCTNCSPLTNNCCSNVRASPEKVCLKFPQGDAAVLSNPVSYEPVVVRPESKSKSRDRLLDSSQLSPQSRLSSPPSRPEPLHTNAHVRLHNSSSPSPTCHQARSGCPLCPVCSRKIQLTAAGLIRQHGPLTARCVGSHKSPVFSILSCPKSIAEGADDSSGISNCTAIHWFLIFIMIPPK